jgi:hypothetical protein
MTHNKGARKEMPFFNQNATKSGLGVRVNNNPPQVLGNYTRARWSPDISNSIMVSISACHAEDRGSIPRSGALLLPSLTC